MTAGFWLSAAFLIALMVGLAVRHIAALFNLANNAPVSARKDDGA